LSIGEAPIGYRLRLQLRPRDPGFRPEVASNARSPNVKR